MPKRPTSDTNYPNKSICMSKMNVYFKKMKVGKLKSYTMKILHHVPIWPITNHSFRSIYFDGFLPIFSICFCFFPGIFQPAMLNFQRVNVIIDWCFTTLWNSYSKLPCSSLIKSVEIPLDNPMARHRSGFAAGSPLGVEHQPRWTRRSKYFLLGPGLQEIQWVLDLRNLENYKIKNMRFNMSQLFNHIPRKFRSQTSDNMQRWKIDVSSWFPVFTH